MQRTMAIENFEAGKTWVLIATDVVARGVDFKDVNIVINFDVPTCTIDYVHRIGEEPAQLVCEALPAALISRYALIYIWLCRPLRQGW